MRKLVFLLALALVLMPALALADDFADVKAYGDQTAEYGTGVMLVDPGFESGWSVSKENSVSLNITDFCAENNSPSCWSDCGMNVGQLKIDFSYNDTDTFSVFNNKFTSYSSSGMADMSSLGGVSLCASGFWCPPNASGSLYQNQTVCQNSGGFATNFNSCTGTLSFMSAGSAYTGTQTINISVDNSWY